jgi:hypothetical protein
MTIVIKPKFKRIPGLRGDMTTTAFACRRKFLRFFSEGFRDETYEAWERGYKYRAHTQWNDALSQHNFRQLLDVGKFGDIAAHATRIESRTNLLFSFEKMALRDAVRSTEGAKVFARGLYAFLHSDGPKQRRFEEWCATVATLPRKQTRVLTWPLVTVFGFIAQPETHMFLKPRVTQLAADAYGVEFLYRSKPNWDTYQSLLLFARRVLRDQRDLHPKDMIDAQSFIWVQGSDEYPEV